MKNSNPNHVAIVLDGNRRFAKRLMLEPWLGHEYGFAKVEKILDHARELKIKEVTLYCLSVDNIKNRPKNYGNASANRQIKKETKIQIACRPQMFPVRPETRLHEEIRFVPDLLPGERASRLHPGHHESVVVK